MGAEDLALADEGDVHILARAQVLTQRREHRAPLLSLEAADSIHILTVVCHYHYEVILFLENRIITELERRMISFHYLNNMRTE